MSTQEMLESLTSANAFHSSLSVSGRAFHLWPRILEISGLDSRGCWAATTA